MKRLAIILLFATPAFCQDNKFTQIESRGLHIRDLPLTIEYYNGTEWQHSHSTPEGNGTPLFSMGKESCALGPMKVFNPLDKDHPVAWELSAGADYPSGCSKAKP
jgi:hypothetical protein